MKLFGSYTRWAADLPAPDAGTPVRMALTTIDSAMRWCMHAGMPGPVHLNCQFREPLVPAAQPWPREVLKVRDAEGLYVG